MSEKFKNGAVIILTSAASGQDLCAPPQARGGVLGKGKGGKWARWVVHVTGVKQCRLSKLTDSKSYLRIHNDRLDAEGGEGPFTLFNIIDGKGDNVSLASVAHPGQHVGILPNGEAKQPSKTKTGKHGTFTVKLASAGRGGLFADGTVIRLQSVATGKNLRIHPDGKVDGHGEQGDFAKFVVHDARGDFIRLSSFADRKKYLRVQPDGDLDGLGGEGEWTLLKPVKKGPGLYVLQSAKNPGWHVGILPNGQAKNGKMTGEGEHGQFRITRA